jgi:hypothetical protein
LARGLGIVRLNCIRHCLSDSVLTVENCS